MSSYHFFERMERELNLLFEYKKLETALYKHHYAIGSIEIFFEDIFQHWKYRQNYMSLKELREAMGFRVLSSGYEDLKSLVQTERITINMSDFLPIVN